MRSDAIDQWLSSRFEQPVRLQWEGSFSDSLRGRFDGVRLEVAGIATAWLPLQRIALSATCAQITPGLPAVLRVEGPVVSVTVGQGDLDRWQDRFPLPFRLRLGERGLTVSTEIAGVPISELETRLEVVRGWFVLRPRKASLMGIPAYAAPLFSAYLPVPPLSPEARLVGIDHAPGGLTLRIAVSDFEETISPGMMRRLRRRLLPRLG